MSFYVQLDRAGGETLHLQLVSQTRRAILARRLPAGARLPATRVIAAELGISRNVVVSAFDELISEGYLEARVGSGTYVAHDLPLLPGGALATPTGAPRWLRDTPPTSAIGVPPSPDQIDFRLGQPTIALLPLSVWRAAWRDALGALPSATYGPVAGDPALRVAIADYLGRARGIACGPDDVVVTAGAAQALELIARATLAPGDAVGMEEPGYPEARASFLARGARIVPMPVDDDGLCVDALPIGPDAPLLIYVTPSHQYPLGARLPVGRRIALLAWAAAHNSLIIEDDYDSEFRFDAPHCLRWWDSTTRALTPESARQTPWPVQRALTHFLASGDLERHIRRMRRYYAAQHAALRDALAPIAPLARLQGLEAGLHAYLALRPDLDPETIIARAATRGVIVYSLAPYYLGEPDRNGILLGYGGLALDDVARGARILAEVISEVATTSR